MKKLLLTLVLGAFAFGAQGQTIPNGSFENFTTNPYSITGWVPISGSITHRQALTVNNGSNVDTLRASDGAYFVQVSSTHDTVNNSVTRGSMGTKFHITGKPDSITFDYSYFTNLPNVDKWQVALQLSGTNTTTNQREMVATEIIVPSTAGGTYPWTRWSQSIDYTSTTTPDSAVIIIQSFATGQSSSGTNVAFLIDNMAFVTNPSTSIVEETNQTSFSNDFGVYPNPFTTTTNIRYTLNQNEMVSLQVFDAQGRLVSNLVNENQVAGQHQVQFDGTNLESGVYFYRLNAGDATRTERMILAK